MSCGCVAELLQIYWPVAQLELELGLLPRRPTCLLVICFSRFLPYLFSTKTFFSQTIQFPHRNWPISIFQPRDVKENSTVLVHISHPAFVYTFCVRIEFANWLHEQLVFLSVFEPGINYNYYSFRARFISLALNFVHNQRIQFELSRDMLGCAAGAIFTVGVRLGRWKRYWLFPTKG